MKVRAQLKNYRMSPRKIRVVSDTVKGFAPDEAVARLRACPREAAGMLVVLIKGAVANAENNFQLDKGLLFVKDIIVDEATSLKRWRARSHGRAARIIKRVSHITVVLEDRRDLTVKNDDLIQQEKKKVLKEKVVSTAKKEKSSEKILLKKEKKTPAKKNEDLTNVEKKGKKVSKLEK
ncbi:MAG: 50S ribosomal protein L22 [Candidatus Moraniibacteriota bacterium]|nr:MAG: 50S ribosomal protein L22 [Candidatus Moranbacteria bacterium]